MFEVALVVSGFGLILMLFRIGIAVQTDAMVRALPLNDAEMTAQRQRNPFYKGTLVPVVLAKDAFRMYLVILAGFALGSLLLFGLGRITGQSYLETFFITFFALLSSATTLSAMRYARSDRNVLGPHGPIELSRTVRRRGFRLIAQLSLLVQLFVTSLAATLDPSFETAGYPLRTVPVLGLGLVLFNVLVLGSTYVSKNLKGQEDRRVRPGASDEEKDADAPAIPFVPNKAKGTILNLKLVTGALVVAATALVAIFVPIGLKFALTVDPDRSIIGAFGHLDRVVVSVTTGVAGLGSFALLKMTVPTVQNPLSAAARQVTACVFLTGLFSLICYFVIMAIPDRVAPWASAAWVFLGIPVVSWLCGERTSFRKKEDKERWTDGIGYTTSLSVIPLLFGILTDNLASVRAGLYLIFFVVSALAAREIVWRFSGRNPALPN